MRILVSFFLLLPLMGCPSQTETVETPADTGEAGPCSADADCGIWGKCMQGVCATDLCAGGACEDNECADKNDCEVGMVCIDSQCVDPPENCAGPEDCPTGTTCDTWTHQCVIDPDAGTSTGVSVADAGLPVNDGCTSREDCPPGMVCIGRQCVDPPENCTSSEDCPIGLVCDAFTGECVDPGATGSEDFDAGTGTGTGTGTGDTPAGTESCLGAPLLPGAGGTIEGNYGILNDYEYHHASNIDGCSNISLSSGREVVYGVMLDPNAVLTVTVDAICNTCGSDGHIDEVIYLLNTCPEDGVTFASGIDNCAVGADDNNGGGSSSPETFTYTHTGSTSETFYIVIDTWCSMPAADNSFTCATSADGFTLTWGVQ